MNYHWRVIAVTCWEERIDGLHFNQEKFAELLVKECMHVVADAVDQREPASTYVNKIKEHFGIQDEV